MLTRILLCVVGSLTVTSTSSFSVSPHKQNVNRIGQTTTAPHISHRTFTTYAGVSHSMVHDSTSDDGRRSVRTVLRQFSGFSLTAVRATMRAATGISLTAIYASTLAVTGAWMRQTMKVCLSVFPAWARYFVQPFLILYYAPLFILRNLSGPQRKQGKSKHECFVESWKQAVETADETSSYWPLHINSEGEFEKDIEEMDTNEAVAESIQMVMEENTSSSGSQSI